MARSAGSALLPEATQSDQSEQIDGSADQQQDAEFLRLTFCFHFPPTLYKKSPWDPFKQHAHIRLSDSPTSLMRFIEKIRVAVMTKTLIQKRLSEGFHIELIPSIIFTDAGTLKNVPLTIINLSLTKLSSMRKWASLAQPHHPDRQQNELCIDVKVTHNIEGDPLTAVETSVDYQLAGATTRKHGATWKVSPHDTMSDLWLAAQKTTDYLLPTLNALLEASKEVPGCLKRAHCWIETDQDNDSHNPLLNHYVRLDQQGHYRFQTIGDLFRPEELLAPNKPILHIIIECEAEKGAEDPHAALHIGFLSSNVTERYQRTGTVALDQFQPAVQKLFKPIELIVGVQPESTKQPINNTLDKHSEMVYTSVQDKFRATHILVPARRVNNMWLGSIRDSTLQMGSGIAGSEGRSALDDSDDGVVRELFDLEKVDTPIEPDLTFKLYTPPPPKPLVNDEPRYPIFLAIRFVNMLPPSWNTQKVRFPPDVVLTVHECKDKRVQHQKICESLTKLLEKVDIPGIPDEYKTTMLFANGRKKDWRFLLWVMPQQQQDSRRLYLKTSEQGLEDFLMNEDVQVEGGNMRLYFEAHLVRKKEAKSTWRPLDAGGESSTSESADTGGTVDTEPVEGVGGGDNEASERPSEDYDPGSWSPLPGGVVEG